MALTSAFRERLERMEHSRNQRLLLLQAEKELQANKSQVLESKLAHIRSMEQRCLFLNEKIASQNFKISAFKSEIENVEAKVLKSEIEELEEVEKEKDKFYELKCSEINEFRETVEKFLMESQIQVQELRNSVDELKSTFNMELQGNNEYMNNYEIAEAEIRRAELLAMKESLTKSLASNYQIRADLQKQVENMLAMKESLTKSLASNYQIRADLQKQVENMLAVQNQELFQPKEKQMCQA